MRLDAGWQWWERREVREVREVSEVREVRELFSEGADEHAGSERVSEGGREGVSE